MRIRPGFIGVVLALAALTGCATSNGVCASSVQPPPLRVGEGSAPTVSGSAVQAPTILRRVNPLAPNSLVGKNVEATVEAVIDTKGIPRNICYASGDKIWGRAMADALREWRFRPGTLEGKPVEVYFSLTSRLDGTQRAVKP